MLNSKDKEILKKRGISEDQINAQLRSFATGFPYLEIRSAAETGNGILQITDSDRLSFINEWVEYLKSDASVLKFVPASGAASRMFKDLFEFVQSENNEPSKPSEIAFFDNLKKFAFYNELNKSCLLHEGKDIPSLLEEKAYKPIVENLLQSSGLNYGALPKGLLQFHTYPDETRTPVQEHLVEGALYATTKANHVNIHFTVSNDHRALFENHLSNVTGQYEQKFNVNYNISFSEQKPSTDTIAADTNNEPFRDNDELVFRPGGHGALIENLNDLNADVIFIKNIDNVVPDSIKPATITYKKLIAGLLIHLQKQCFGYLQELESDSISDNKLAEILNFCENKLNIHHSGINASNSSGLKNYLFAKLNRPIRVCGMVRNQGEPGGGPFMTVNSDGSVSPQILESSQINLNNPADKEILARSTHFNPVDLVCGIKNYKGEKFNLLNFIDKKTGFISLKSKNGKELKALELPGLWNGAMSDWNTVFVEVPIDTFNPVKTVNDLLRPEHQ